MLESVCDATDADSPSGLNGVFSGHPCPEIAVGEWEYQEILIPSQSHKFIVGTHSILPRVTDKPLFTPEVFYGIAPSRLYTWILWLDEMVIIFEVAEIIQAFLSKQSSYGYTGDLS